MIHGFRGLTDTATARTEPEAITGGNIPVSPFASVPLFLGGDSVLAVLSVHMG
jgi:hypothetical protein